MAQKEKQLLLIDLCAREPYHPRIHVFNAGYEGFQDGDFDTNLWLHHIDAFRFDRIEIRPYLRSMNSMTEKERKELSHYENSVQRTDFYYSHHIDCRYMIKKGLALEAPEGMYNLKEK